MSSGSSPSLFSKASQGEPGDQSSTARRPSGPTCNQAGERGSTCAAQAPECRLLLPPRWLGPGGGRLRRRQQPEGSKGRNSPQLTNMPSHLGNSSLRLAVFALLAALVLGAPAPPVGRPELFRAGGVQCPDPAKTCPVRATPLGFFFCARATEASPGCPFEHVPRPQRCRRCPRNCRRAAVRCQRSVLCAR